MTKKIILFLSLCWLVSTIGYAQEHEVHQHGEHEELISKIRQEHPGISEEEVHYQLEKILNPKSKLSHDPNAANRVPIPILNTGCANMDFSNNTADWTYHWTNHSYDLRPSQDPNANSEYGDSNSAVIPALSHPHRFEVFNGTTFDPIFGQSIVPDGSFQNIIRLGEPLIHGTGQEEVSKSFTVSEANAVLQFGFAIAFEDPIHPNDPNSFDVFIEVNGVPQINCATISYTFQDATTINGFIDSPLNPNVKIRPWTVHSIDLLSDPNINPGDLITISFRNRDCGLGGHASHAYVSAMCLPRTGAIEAVSDSGVLCVGDPITFSTLTDIFQDDILNWTITSGQTIVATGTNPTLTHTFTQSGNYTVNFSITRDSCVFNYSLDIVVAENCCLDCETTAQNIIDNIVPTDDCGWYLIPVSEDTLECYTIRFFGPNEPSGGTIIGATDHLFTIQEDGMHNVSVTLTAIDDPNDVCSAQGQLEVNCCPDCETTAQGIMDGIVPTNNCGEYLITVTEEILDCYSILFFGPDEPSSGTLIDTPQHTFSIAQDGLHEISVVLTKIADSTVTCTSVREVLIECCPECADEGAFITDSISATSNCGEFALSISDNLFNCYELTFYPGDTPGNGIVVTEDMVSNGTFTYTYEDIGTYNATVVLADSGGKCFVGRKDLRVDCIDCKSLIATIMDSIESTETCGEFIIHIPEEAFNYYNFLLFVPDDPTLSGPITSTEHLLVFENSDAYSVSITAIDIENPRNQCFATTTLEAYCHPSCYWPKAIGTNNQGDQDYHDSEYVSNTVEDSNDDLIALGRAKEGADIDGYTLGATGGYLSKYNLEGCIMEVKELRDVKYPWEMFILDNDDLIITSSELQPDFNENKYYVDRYRPDGELLWRTQIHMPLMDGNRTIRTTLNPTTNDIYLVISKHNGLAGVVSDYYGNVDTLENTAIIRLDEFGRLTWKEEISTESKYKTIRGYDISFNPQTGMLFVLLNIKVGATALFETSNIELFYSQPNINSQHRYFVANYRIGSDNIPNFDSHFGTSTGARFSPISRIVSNNEYVYIGQNAGSDYTGIFTHAFTGQLLNVDVYPHSSYEMKLLDSGEILSVGATQYGNHGIGFSKIQGMQTLWTYAYQSAKDAAFPMDIIVTSHDKIFVTGTFQSDEPIFNDHIGWYDGYIVRYKEENGDVTPEEIIQPPIAGKDTWLSIYPNPSHPETIINFEGISFKEVSTIEIYDALGNRKTMMTPKANSFEVPRLQPGVYFVRFTTSKGVEHKQLIIE